MPPPAPPRRPVGAGHTPDAHRPRKPRPSNYPRRTKPELIGIPCVVVVGRHLADGYVEVRDRATGGRDEVPWDGLADQLLSRVRGNGV
ncbi:His/Gly/Thr/Pro-type tRNA ligase C-terminal domain-containing protein [Micromonospora sp. HUAS LYJ1]|uniref:His/Gly/Thr/Pro-type tRNA ligase C-terminal domain-containing protein n=1 Tax=Micromonospora sp. HUAS LYJ1 TaxID=3061626 RepID=UPI002673E806|nr:His/Gly/Thr/Pro-type tRNA ligase C-terminal domain-containing protein [Micromonospora sp. HUAS LYJ1]WKU03196.1 His/Gly/Thr/Pro-type tRNA ligase C-terminal domain-containing protein [Micromonospora sp. HUAS LYJ1]